MCPPWAVASYLHSMLPDVADTGRQDSCCAKGGAMVFTAPGSKTAHDSWPLPSHTVHTPAGGNRLGRGGDQFPPLAAMWYWAGGAPASIGVMADTGWKQPCLLAHPLFWGQAPSPRVPSGQDCFHPASLAVLQRPKPLLLPVDLPVDSV